MKRIPTNLITGFLGVGKTTLISHLLHTRPPGQRWAVLVNEFGEVGIDGALLESDGVVLREVAGGCLCCVAAPAFTTGLNRLIREARPDRILIEPSGLGHPAQVLRQLSSPPYDAVLELRSSVGVLDARHLSSARHRAHPDFQDQLHLADVLVANKADRYSGHDVQMFEDWLRQDANARTKTAMVEQGRMDPGWLDTERSAARKAAFPEAHAFLIDQAGPVAAGPARDWVVIEGRGDGYFRCGWVIAETFSFPHQALRDWLDGLGMDRVKGVFRTEQGGLGYNRAEDAAALSRPGPVTGSRLTVIHHASIDRALLDRGLRHLANLNTA